MTFLCRQRVDQDEIPRLSDTTAVELTHTTRNCLLNSTCDEVVVLNCNVHATNVIVTLISVDVSDCPTVLFASFLSDWAIAGHIPTHELLPFGFCSELMPTLILSGLLCRPDDGGMGDALAFA